MTFPLPSGYTLPARRKGFVAKRSEFGSAYALFHNGFFFCEVSLCDVGDMGIWVYVGAGQDLVANFGFSPDMTPREMFPCIRAAYEAEAAEYEAEARAEAAAEEAAERAAYREAYDWQEREAARWGAF